MEIPVEKLVEIAAKTAIQEYKGLQQPEYLSEKQARKRYKGLVDYWEMQGLVNPVPSKKGRLLYPTNRLVELYAIHCTKQ